MVFMELLLLFPCLLQSRVEGLRQVLMAQLNFADSLILHFQGLRRGLMAQLDLTDAFVLICYVCTVGRHDFCEEFYVRGDYLGHNLSYAVGNVVHRQQRSSPKVRRQLLLILWDWCFRGDFSFKRHAAK